MITKAKVSASAVKAFEQSASNIRDYSDMFDRGILCLEQLLQILSECKIALSEKEEKISVTSKTLSTKIESIKEDISRLTTKIEKLEERLSDLNEELSCTDATITITGTDGVTTEVPNPAYEAIEANIRQVENEISELQEELQPLQERLDRAYSVDNKLSVHLDSLKSVIYSIEEKASACKHLIDELGDIKTSNKNLGTIAVDALKKIEQIIGAYVRTKMNYDSTSVSGSVASASGRNININVNIVKSNDTPQDIHTNPENNVKQDLQANITQSNQATSKATPLDIPGVRILGGKYNTYDERIKFTSQNNPILGGYTGKRGESKYIPSNRSVEGIIVIDILKQYGLDGIEYRNAEPDFEACAEAVVTIPRMTENREDYYDVSGERQLGNFSQADIELAQIWNFEELDGRSNWTARDVHDYRKAHKLSWHEKCDTKTMVLVRTEINGYFKHLGGCAECRVRDGNSIDDGGFDE